MAITALLQSSTATVLIVAAFAGQGMIKSGAGLAMVLGADVGTTLVAQIFWLDLSLLIPIFIVVGYISFSMDRSGRIKNLGRILIGLALMLIALSMIKTAAAPLKTSEALPVILNILQADYLFAVLFIALLTWVSHSSLAIILLLMSFVAAGVLPLMLGLYMVLGANLGGTIPPILATLKDHPEARRIPIGNFLIRLCGVGVLFFTLPLVQPYIEMMDDNAEHQIVNFHMMFNIALAVVFLPFTPMISQLCTKFIPDRVEPDNPGTARYLDLKDMDTPSIALASATRETLRMADLVQRMLEETITVFKTNDKRLLEKVREDDDVIDKIYSQIKSYMARLSQEFMDPKEAQRYVQILTFSTNLEHAGDVIDKNLMPVALKKIKSDSHFSEEGMKEIEHIHNLVVESVQLAQSIFVSNDIDMARRLLQDKQDIREAEITGMTKHIERLSEGRPETIATSSFHVDIIRDYRRINSYMCTVAYPLLEEKGELRQTRLRVLDVE